METFCFARAMGSTGGDKELLTELIELFQQNKDEILTDIVKAIENQDHNSLHRLAHSLKGSLGAIGAEKSHELSHSLEVMGMNNDLSEAGITLDKLKEELDCYDKAVNVLEYK